MRILMVCLGNICRSPIAEGVLQHLADKHSLPWSVDSAGTESYHIGEAPHRFSQKICKEKGIDIAHQRARKFTKEDVHRYDKIYALADDVLEEIKSITGQNFDATKIDLLLNELHPGMNQSVPDPWYGGEEGYLPVFEMIEAACKALISKYRQ